MIYLVVLFLSSLSSVLILHTTQPLITFLHSARRVEYMTVMFIAAMAVTDRKNLKFFIKLTFVSALVATLYGLGQKFFALPVISTMNNEFSRGLALNLGPEARISSTFAGHYDLSAYLVTVLLVVLGILIYLKKLPQKIGVFTLFTLFVWLMIGSASRVSLVAYLIVAILLLLLTRKFILLIFVLVVSLSLAAFSQSLTSRYAGLTNVVVKSVYSRYLTLINRPTSNLDTGTNLTSPTPTPTPTLLQVSQARVVKGTPKPTPKPRKPRPTPQPEAQPILEDRSASIRFNVEWPRAIRAFEKNPLLGTGPSSITLATDNDYLRSLGETGALGFVALVGVFVQIWVTTKHLIRKPDTTLEWAFGLSVVFGVIGLLLNAAFIDVFEASKVAITFWVLMGIVVGVARLPKSKLP
jgi:hypothetical protein